MFLGIVALLQISSAQLLHDTQLHPFIHFMLITEGVFQRVRGAHCFWVAASEEPRAQVLQPHLCERVTSESLHLLHYVARAIF